VFKVASGLSSVAAGLQTRALTSQTVGSEDRTPPQLRLLELSPHDEVVSRAHRRDVNESTV